MRFTRSLTIAAAALLATTAVASAEHESQNIVEFTRTEVAPERTDGFGFSL